MLNANSKDGLPKFLFIPLDDGDLVVTFVILLQAGVNLAHLAG